MGVTRTPRLTPEQIAAHLAECEGCSICQGEPPPMTRLERLHGLVQAVEMFGAVGDDGQPLPYAGPNRAIGLLESEISAEKATRRQASKPGELRKAERATHDELERFRLNYIKTHQHERGWVKCACNFFDIDRKTLYNRMKME